MKSTSCDSDENTAALAEGITNLFPPTRDRSILSGWQEYLEDVAFGVPVLQEFFPDAGIRPFLMMSDKAKTTQIDRLSKQFGLRRIRSHGSSLNALSSISLETPMVKP